MSIKELIVPVAVMGVLASLLLPLPPAVLDFLLVGNIVLALVLLASTLYVSDPLKLSALPSILLLTTLYRLALNVSTTRLILGSGDAGQVIAAFGSVVISDNLIVGVVVFLIITLIQFIVIAKGSERVAEVSARFTLDALPGKQMSIDADLRSGLIDAAEAREKRQQLQTESRFYGALDGAMKFIKGDAIAGMVITAVNVVGGLALGIFVHELEWTAALSRYTLLTVGDGLLSQIPALLNSLAAGMVVTRVERGDGTSLACELLTQIGQVKKVQVLIGAVAGLLALLPGMPFLPFVCLSALLFIIAGCAPQDKLEEQEPPNSFQPRTPPLLELQLGADTSRLAYEQGHLNEQVDEFRQRIYDRHGIVLPLPDFSLAQGLGSGCRILTRGVQVCELELIEAEHEDLVLTRVLRHVEELIAERAVEFVDDICTRRTLDHFDGYAPELVSAVVPDVITVTKLTALLKALLGEGLSIRNFDVILQAVAEAQSEDARRLLEEVRVALRRLISRIHAPDGAVRVITLDPVLDLAFVKAEREGGRIDLECVERIAECCRELEGVDLVVLVSQGARALLRDCLELHDISVAVLAHEELVPEVKFEVIKHISSVAGAEQDRLIEELAA